MGLYRRTGEAVSRGTDPLYQHKERHVIAAAPTVLIGSRLQEAIGEERAQQIMLLARSGGLVRLRESCLYLEQRGDALILARNVVTAPLARELQLFAIEAIDDAPRRGDADFQRRHERAALPARPRTARAAA